jgi:competence protein ComEC
MSQKKKVKKDKYQKLFGNYLVPANFLLGFLVAFLGGVILASLGKIFFLELITEIIILIFLVILFFQKKDKTKLFYLFVLVLGLTSGIIRTNIILNQSQGWLEGIYQGEGVVIKFSEPKDDYQRVYLKIKGARENKKHKIIIQKETIIFFAPLGINYKYGEHYKIKCELKNPENKYSKFNYQRFLASKKVYQICHKAKIKKIKNKNNFLTQININFHQIIYNFSQAIEGKINHLFPMPESAYLAGLLLGGDNRLPQSVADDFRRTGTTHTVAVSGSNITIIATALMMLGLFFGLWRWQAFYFVLAGILIFIVMIGAPSSAVRAAIMAILLLYASQSGRLVNSLRVIILAAALMVFISPFILLYDVGFQLSFLATLGIVLLYAPLAEKFEIKNDFLELKSIFLVTVSAQLGVLGILIYSFDSISIISLLANVLILPLIPIIMAGGTMAIFVSFVVGLLGNILSIPTQILLHFELNSIQYLAKIPWAIIKFRDVSIWWPIGYYFLFPMVILFFKKKIFN